jgi:hypothetical protein
MNTLHDGLGIDPRALRRGEGAQALPRRPGAAVVF